MKAGRAKKDMRLLSKWNIYRKALLRADEAEEMLRESRATVSQLQHDLLQTQDRIRELFEENVRLRESSLLDRTESTRCRELVADWLASQTGLKPIFGHPFESKRAPEEEPIRSGKILARDLVSELERQFFADESAMADEMLKANNA